MSTDIEIELNLPGIHMWPGAEKYPEVDYLRYPHRHIFCFQLGFKVLHGDRDIEFIMMRNQVEEYLKEKYWSVKHKLLDFEARSCEMIANDLMGRFKASKVRVGEDKEFFGGVK